MFVPAISCKNTAIHLALGHGEVFVNLVFRVFTKYDHWASSQLGTPQVTKQFGHHAKAIRSH